jgi:tetratricopeptide (TPR) repeat protein
MPDQFQPQNTPIENAENGEPVRSASKSPARKWWIAACIALFVILLGFASYLMCREDSIDTREAGPAFDEYTQIIDSSDATHAMKVDAYAGRAQLYFEIGDEAGVESDIEAVLCMKDLQMNEAIRMRGLRVNLLDTERKDATFGEDCRFVRNSIDKVMEDSSLLPEAKAQAALGAAFVYETEGDYTEGARICDEALKLSNISPLTKAWLLYRNAGFLYYMGKSAEAMEVYIALVEDPDTSPRQKAMSFCQLGRIRQYMLVDRDESLKWYACALAVPGLPERNKASAYLLRAELRDDMGDVQGAIEDAEAGLRLKTSFLHARKATLFDHALYEKESDNYTAAMADYAQIINDRRMSAKSKSEAHDWRGYLYYSVFKDYENAISEFDTVVEATSFANESFYLDSIRFRASSKLAMKNYKGAIEDAVLAMTSPVLDGKKRSDVLETMALAKYWSGDLVGAASVFSELVAIPEVSPSRLAKAYYNRGIIERKLGDLASAAMDFRSVTELQGAPEDLVRTASNILREMGR